MIEPRRAPVRPHVLSSASGEKILLEDEIRALVEEGAAVDIVLEGPPGSGKSTALRHLAAVLGGEPRLRLVDARDGVWEEGRVPEGSRRLVTVYEDKQLPAPLRSARLVHYRLAPWDADDRLEYLMATHRDECASVLARLGDDDPFAGLPELWRVALDQLAVDPSTSSPRAGLRRHVRGQYSLCGNADFVRATLLAAVRFRSAEALGLLRRLKEGCAPSDLWLVLRHPAARLLMAVAEAVDLLRQGRDCDCLNRPLLLPFVQEMAREVGAQGPARTQLLKLLDGPDVCHSQVASILHATDSGWLPNAERPPRLSGAHLRGAAWPDLRLVDAQLAQADLRQSDLRRADLSGAAAEGVRFADTCLQRANLSRMKAFRGGFQRTDLSFADAHEGHFLKASFKKAILEHANFQGASLEQANLTGVQAAEADFRHADLTGAYLDGADFRDVNFLFAKLPAIDLKSACCTGASFVRAILKRSDLEGLDLSGTDFREADLESALLTGTTCPDGRFDGACLRHAGLAEIDWERASLQGADLTGASFHLGTSRSGLVGSPIASEGSRTGFYTDDYHDQDFKAPEEIRKANLRNADLRGAKIEDVDFYLVDLRGALLDPEQMEHARRCGAILESRC